MKGLKHLNSSMMPCTLAAYASDLIKSGIPVVDGSNETIWAGYESYAMMRIPTFASHQPSQAEIEGIFRKRKVALVAYLTQAGKQTIGNAKWYVCTDRAYSLEKLDPAVRRNVRRGLREFVIEPLSPEQVLAHGMQAFCDTRKRVGLSDGPGEFRRRFMARGKCSGHVFLGAWKDEFLAAFLSITEIDDWAEIEGSFSRNDFLSLRPNEALMYAALSRYLALEGKRLVSYGLSSVQQAGDAEGLHAFKTKVGFQSEVVNRVFILNPVLRPAVNRLTVKSVNMLRELFPRNRFLNKASGVMNIWVGDGGKA